MQFQNFAHVTCFSSNLLLQAVSVHISALINSKYITCVVMLNNTGVCHVFGVHVCVHGGRCYGAASIRLMLLFCWVLLHTPSKFSQLDCF